MRSADNGSPYLFSFPPTTTHALTATTRTLRSVAAVAFVLALAACGGDGAGSSMSGGSSAKPDAALSSTDGSNATSGKKDDGEVRYAP